MIRKLIPLLILLAMLLTACGSSPKALAQGQSGAAKQGQALFVENCGECHGKDGSGTDEAPAVMGHTSEEVKNQVRNPEGDMKAIPPEKLSDADLSALVDYVTSLGGADAHPDIKPSTEEATHLKVAFEAIKDKDNMDRNSAISHLEQAAALASGETAKVYQDMIDAIKAEKAGNARHELEELLGIEMESK